MAEHAPALARSYGKVGLKQSDRRARLLIKKPTFFGSTASVLLLFSVISYSRTYIQQDPKQVQQQPSNSQVSSASEPPSASAKDAAAPTKPGVDPARPAQNPSSSVKQTPVINLAGSYTATAYSLRGRTASGKPVARGLIAADPRVLPLGTRVRIEAGEFTGEYVVADTGGSVKGHRVDIWTPTPREAMRFGKRAIKLTILELGGRKPNSRATLVPVAPVQIQPEAKPQK